MVEAVLTHLVAPGLRHPDAGAVRASDAYAPAEESIISSAGIGPPIDQPMLEIFQVEPDLTSVTVSS
jgi:hypothetical protein